MSVLLFSISSTSVPQSQRQIVTLMMDIHSPPHDPSPGLGSLPSPLSVLRGQQIGGVDQLDNHVHQFRENRRQPCILTSLALSSRWVKDNRKNETGLVGARRESATADCLFSSVIFILGSNLGAICLHLSSGPFGFISGCYKDNTNKYTIM